MLSHAYQTAATDHTVQCEHTIIVGTFERAATVTLHPISRRASAYTHTARTCRLRAAGHAGTQHQRIIKIIAIFTCAMYGRLYGHLTFVQIAGQHLICNTHNIHFVNNPITGYEYTCRLAPSGDVAGA
jgi:hypothetical protein